MSLCLKQTISEKSIKQYLLTLLDTLARWTVLAFPAQLFRSYVSVSKAKQLAVGDSSARGSGPRSTFVPRSSLILLGSQVKILLEMDNSQVTKTFYSLVGTSETIRLLSIFSNKGCRSYVRAITLGGSGKSKQFNPQF